MRMRLFSHVLLSVGTMMILPGQAAMTAEDKAPWKPLRGQIITNASEIEIPPFDQHFIPSVRKQDVRMFAKDDQGQWTIHFLAFFQNPLPKKHLGVVVLSASQNPVAVAKIQGERGSTSIASEIVISYTDTPSRYHWIQVYYLNGRKPIVLAKTKVVLK